MYKKSAEVAEEYLILREDNRIFEAKIIALEERLKVAVEALEKLKNGPGNKMVGWKSTWAHIFSAQELARIEKMKEEG